MYSTLVDQIKPLMNKLKVLNNMSSLRSSSTRTSKAIDLTTGGLPTFVDDGNSFGTPAIFEDDFINE
ncbi:alkaline-phosphatase-like protein, putative [Medicago truncatula]|uniref:Alkaline-phosphatase-like protein, putative n=1 Tax=Medicago truncatula TaxID=3880 RepID=G7KR26_MEDTR|nr:alkaline-phosphatase-like protein, putative [Medicago truncatula]